MRRRPVRRASRLLSLVPPECERCGDRLAAAARYLDLPNASFNGFLEWVLELRHTLGIPRTLAGLGVDETHVDRIGELAVADPSSGTNPIAFTAKEYEKIFRRALEGRLGLEESHR